ncbi:MAG: four helix bundle protein [Candidatus Peribacteria bacterium]|nr:MAG: four helix bundle protein [Candidatus Peribacteria bacterium]
MIRFLYIAKGSTGEVRNMIIIAHDLQYITNEQFDTYIEVLNKISA